MKVIRRVATVLICLVIGQAAFADTVAIAVRPTGVVAESVEAAEFVEYGAMDTYFFSGHIVFDLTVDPTDELYSYRAVAEARLGGADYVVVFDVEFIAEPGRGVVPTEGRYEIIRLDGTRDESTDVVVVSTLPGSEDLDAAGLAEALGRELAAQAIERVQEG
jgi:hypothetical protein